MTDQADGSASGADVELPARLADELSLLALGVVRDGDGLIDGLASLVDTLTDAVSGYVGLRLTIVHSGHPVRLSAYLPTAATEPARSSLRLPLPLVSSAFEDGGLLVVWSTVPGALVDLSADLGYVFRGSADGSSGLADDLQLDADLPVPTTDSGVDGLAELTTIHQAVGLLLDRGADAATVHEVLRRDASAAGLSTSAWAARVLRRR